ncbi:MAG: type II toxin-antitoxin system RelB/DinJ family antitoxin [Clostridia bacterium]|nr:type II toxin-antitoxin system RelB/DinJ family antitoxin [Clostridia bacterium]
MASVNVTIRVDEELKQQVDSLFANLGLTLSGAVNVFFKQTVREQGIPVQNFKGRSESGNYRDQRGSTTS